MTESIHDIDAVTNILSTAREKRFLRISTRNIEYRSAVQKICIAKRPHYGDAHLYDTAKPFCGSL
ncbi:hypothetical protein [Afipia massiliensis]|uniref:hypothetical protein n=1 Tax=Afipia massiliensis TaxID=211460 RepID=UPI001AED85C8|nr:hypothetical protein [Afipia massiliensis]